MRSILYILFAVGGVLVAIALSMVLLDDEGGQEVKPQSPSIELSKPAAGEAETPGASKDSGISLQPSNVRPLTIDLARVKPDGAAVFAGMAAPNAKIRIFEGNILLGETVASANGEWVIVLEKSLAAGQHLISVAMERSDGTTKMADRSLAVEIYQDTETKPLVALLPETATEVPLLIQSPDDVDTVKPATAANEAAKADAAMPETTEAAPANPQAMSQIALLAPSAIVWRDASRILISGTSRGGVRVAVNDTKGQFGEALVLADGAWQVAGSLDMNIEANQLRFALFDDANQIIARYDLPVKARDLAKGQDGSPLVVVNKGDILWRIAYHQLGEGVKYVDIVRRNKQDIINPDLIYPNQIFAVPQSSITASDKN
ncbi:LysM peptidoglycan-binding domain-containing protein [Candidatus Puniceispirillum sp.]|nr:LysM peptidoglycan-binding domain-containing protein [Alphaproteobacteria bacterium]MDC1294179.1 LysM peptidoglycan-binding domain-containing protein [Candidatus Puniceispirillum sp.]